MKRFFVLLSIAAIAASVSAYAATSRADLNERLSNSRTVIQELASTPDRGVPNSIIKQAVCVAVVPSMKKAAFVFGGQYGQGVVTCRTGHGWSAPVFIRLGGGSFGFQLGAQATDLVIVAVNQRGMQDLLKSKFKIGGNASAAAGPVGRNASASTSANMSAELLTYSRSKGLFAGIDLSGDSVSQNQGDTDTYYGRHYSFHQLLGGQVAVPVDARPFVESVARYFRVSQ